MFESGAIIVRFSVHYFPSSLCRDPLFEVKRSANNLSYKSRFDRDFIRNLILIGCSCVQT